MTVAGAIAAGIGFVHQELNLFDNLDAAANVFIGREPLQGGPLRLVDRARLHAAVEPLFARLGVDFAPDAPVAGLSLAQRQLIEIAKALSLDSRLVIMDEPTSSLTLAETGRLLKVIAELRASGVSVIFISHRLDEVTACADRVVVLRDGRLVGRLAKAEIAPAAMIRLMIGRDLKAIYKPPAAPPGGPLLEIDGRAHRGLPGPDRRADAAPGRDPRARRADRRRAHRARARRSSASTGCSAARCGWPGARSGSARRATRSRKASTWCPRTARRRASCSTGRSPRTSRCRSCRALRGSGWCGARRRTRSPRPSGGGSASARPDVGTLVGTLSGGNQQKVVLAKWLAMRPKAIVFDEPTRGIDVGAKREIYDILRALADAGVAILMISSDMEEVIGVSDRIAVMHEGAISGILERDGVLRAPGARAGGRARVGTAHAEEGLRPPRPDPGRRRHRRADQPALPLADQPRQHRQPRRPVRALRDRPGVRDHHRRHRALGRLGDRAARRALRRPRSSTSACPGRPPSC